MKCILVFFLVLNVSYSFAQTKSKIIQILNPTGIYSLNLTYKDKDGERYGYYGSIKIKQLKGSWVAMSFFVCKGAPSYNSGSFVDTIEFRNNVISYTPLEFDSTCVLTFRFSPKGVSVYQQAENINNACGFGHGVSANDLFYKKVSSQIPEIKDPLVE